MGEQQCPWSGKGMPSGRVMPHTARRPPVHSGWPRRNDDDDVPKEWPSDHSMPLGLKQTSSFTPLPGLLQTRLLRATFYISHSANTFLLLGQDCARHSRVCRLGCAYWHLRLSCYISSESLTRGRPQRHRQAQEVLL